MPSYSIASCDLEVSRDAVILDTNVIVAAFHPRDQRHGDAKALLEILEERQLIIPMVVVVEVWGMLVGSMKQLDCGYEFLTWLNNPGRDLLIPHDSELNSRSRQ